MNVPHRDPSVPHIDPRAFHGPLGDVVRALAPTSEADPVGVLVSLMAFVGAQIGPEPHVLVGSRKQPARIWPLIIGATGAGRKGTATADAESVVSSIDSYFVADNVVSGLSTGEGLINNLRDDDEEHPGVADKRRVVVEPEFARTLGVTRREGNNLSEILRGLWESGHASVLTRGQPLKCTDAHLSVIAHITPRELRLKLSEKDVAGGMMNRFIPVLVHRSQLIPFEVEAADVSEHVKVIGQRIRKARSVDRVRRTPSADALWGNTYRALLKDEPEGPLGEVLARGPVYTLRLALLYALMDGRDVIDAEHLMAALALWHYVTTSSRRVFGNSTGHSDMDKLRGYLQQSPQGRTRTEITALFGRNKPAQEIDELLNELDGGGDLRSEVERTGKAGRPTVRLFWVGRPSDAVSALLQTNESNEATQQPLRQASANEENERTSQPAVTRSTAVPGDYEDDRWELQEPPPEDDWMEAS